MILITLQKAEEKIKEMEIDQEEINASKLEKKINDKYRK